MDNKKSLIVLALVALVGVVGGTYAYFTSKATLNNSFKTGTYSTSVTEEFVSPNNWAPGQKVDKKVNVTNNGTVDIAVRASFTEAWTSSSGASLPTVKDGVRLALFDIGTDWVEATDGWYYYNATLTNGQTTTDFITDVTFNPDYEFGTTDILCTTTTEGNTTEIKCESLNTGYAGATYKLDITIETIQADQKWSYTLPEPYALGTEVTIAGEKFNIISSTDDTVTMLAQFNLDESYRQSETKNLVRFSNSNDWETGIEIDIQQYDGPVKTYINEYVSYLQGETGDMSLSGTLLTLADLETLGCTIEASGSFMRTGCTSSTHAWLLNNNQGFWVRTAHANKTGVVWGCHGDGMLEINDFSGDYYGKYSGVRPLITISKTVLANL